jgi:RNA polymerase sigma-70 factor (ECF subfamily)
MTTAEYNKTVDLYSDNVYRFILKNIKDIHKAEDIVQESFEKLWRNVASVDAEKVKSYLFTTAYHTLIDVLRKEKRTIYTDDLTSKDQSYEIRFSDLKEILNVAVNQLPDIQRMVVMLRDYEGYSYKEIGEVTGLHESQVKVYIYRARIFLKNYIGNVDVLV